jgi:3-isopropylmalate/(R)-2-methylmalate dehydratase large subunit
MGMTMAEKILSRAAGRESPKPGEYVWAQIDRTMSIDMSLVAQDLEKHAVEALWDPDRIVVIHDHDIPPSNLVMANRYAKSRQLVAKYGIQHFYEMGRHGICHQVFMEQGFALPGELVVGIDSHICMYGALNCAARGIHDEHPFLMTTGKLWFRVPETIRFELVGEPPPYLSGKDIILHIVGQFGTDGAMYKSIEFVGSAIQHLTLSERMTIANMGVEMGAKFALFEADQRVRDYVSTRTTEEYSAVFSDEDAEFEQVHRIDLTALEPQIACPHDVSNVKAMAEVKSVPIDQAFLGSCSNGRLEDIAVAAQILKGRKVHPRVRFIVTPASQSIYSAALKHGFIETLMESEAVVTSSSCGPCAGSHNGILADGERCIATTNRNFRGRMGSPSAEIYLASPAIVAASAVAGRITDPRLLMKTADFAMYKGIDEHLEKRRYGADEQE